MSEQALTKTVLASSLGFPAPIGLLAANVQGDHVRLSDGHMRARVSLDQFGAVDVTMPDGSVVTFTRKADGEVSGVGRDGKHVVLAL